MKKTKIDKITIETREDGYQYIVAFDGLSEIPFLYRGGRKNKIKRNGELDSGTKAEYRDLDKIALGGQTTIYTSDGYGNIDKHVVTADDITTEQFSSSDHVMR